MVLYSSLELGTFSFLEEATIDKTTNNSPSKILFRATASASTAINKVSNFW